MILGAAIVTLAFLGAVSVARAASLPVVAAMMSTATVTNPCSGTATATPTNRVGNSGKYRDVTVALDGCLGWLQVTLLENGSPLAPTAQNVVDGDPVVLAGINGHGGYFPESISVVAALNGWNLPTTWSYAP